MAEENNPLISVIMPVFNREKYIREALQSILDDAYHRKEIIVVDDGSTDNSVHIVSEFPEIKIIRQKNQGVAVARNTGIKASGGQFITYLDSDDIWMPGRIELCLDYFVKNSNTDLIMGQEILFLDHAITKPALIKEEWLNQAMDAGNNGVTMLKKSCYDRVGLFNPVYKKGEDTEWHVRAIEAGLNIGRISSVFQWRRVHDANLSFVPGENPNSNLIQIIRESLHRKNKIIPDGRKFTKS